MALCTDYFDIKRIIASGSGRGYAAVGNKREYKIIHTVIRAYTFSDHLLSKKRAQSGRFLQASGGIDGIFLDWMRV